ncbi:hypothetical protein SCH01S_51_00760 [Sphingomonas changbaiensis NBRC 104936]|uniref:Uncharacterized protein n=1 Tax=Sphingomonas changbaiensis NBRC 104936 TaxID=1219043 RepID=A0A0E9MT38_9SPHN|nr:hypothetical protein [Sphingomonas changbaiensis]GAO40744.1 hypothetical protein SCH01S_51_00760 [Sphingomonas changbaiensis NBRC 104936]
MASKTSKPDVENWPGRTIDFVEYGRTLARARAEYEAKNGPIPVPRNAGTRRTASKQALLDAINAITDKQGWRW